jgi:hypothetical protein
MKNGKLLRLGAQEYFFSIENARALAHVKKKQYLCSGMEKLLKQIG